MKEELPQLPLWIDLAAVAFGAMQGGGFGTQARDERNFDILGVVVFAILVGLGGGILRDLLLGRIPAALQDDRYLATALIAGFAGMLLGELITRPRWPLHALDAAVVGLFVVVGALKAQDAGLPGGATILLGTITGVGGGVLRDLIAQQPLVLVQRSTPYALVALLGAIAFVVVDWAGGSKELAALACLAVVFAVRLLALARGWQSPPPVVGSTLKAPYRTVRRRR